jgi:hypothetical protein
MSRARLVLHLAALIVSVAVVIGISLPPLRGLAEMVLAAVLAAQIAAALGARWLLRPAGSTWLLPLGVGLVTGLLAHLLFGPLTALIAIAIGDPEGIGYTTDLALRLSLVSAIFVGWFSLPLTLAASVFASHLRRKELGDTAAGSLAGSVRCESADRMALRPRAVLQLATVALSVGTVIGAYVMLHDFISLCFLLQLGIAAVLAAQIAVALGARWLLRPTASPWLLPLGVGLGMALLTHLLFGPLLAVIVGLCSFAGFDNQSILAVSTIRDMLECSLISLGVIGWISVPSLMAASVFVSRLQRKVLAGSPVSSTQAVTRLAAIGRRATRLAT